MFCTIQDLGDPETVNNYGAVNSSEESRMVSKIYVIFAIHVYCIILCCRIDVLILFQLSDNHPKSANDKEAITDNPSDGIVTDQQTVNRKQKRLKSLDTVRGLVYHIGQRPRQWLLCCLVTLRSLHNTQSTGFHYNASYGH